MELEKDINKWIYADRLFFEILEQNPNWNQEEKKIIGGAWFLNLSFGGLTQDYFKHHLGLNENIEIPEALKPLFKCAIEYKSGIEKFPYQPVGNALTLNVKNIHPPNNKDDNFKHFERLLGEIVQTGILELKIDLSVYDDNRIFRELKDFLKLINSFRDIYEKYGNKVFTRPKRLRPYDLELINNKIKAWKLKMQGKKYDEIAEEIFRKSYDAESMDSHIKTVKNYFKEINQIIEFMEKLKGKY